MSKLEDRRAARQRGEEPITVVGAGPAGLACAIALAKGGRRVVVREWHAGVGHRFHGDFQGLENWSSERDVLDELRAGGIDASFFYTPVSHGTVFDPRGTRHFIQSERPLYYLVRRGSERGTLDHALLQQTIAAGAEVRFADRVDGIDGPGVLAGGPRSADAIAVGYLFDTDMPDGDWLALNDELAPLGYAYLLVHGGRGTVASCLFTGFKQQEEHVARTIAFFRDKAGLVMQHPRRFGGFANFRLPRTATQGGHPVIGEHAGFQDALAGFGLRFAMRSGLLAARSIMHGADYARLWRRDLLPLLRTGTVNRFLFNTIGEDGWARAIRKLSDDDAGITLRRFYQPSLLSRLLFPIAHLHYRRPLRDRSCDHTGCACVWCQHGAETASSTVCVGDDGGRQLRGRAGGDPRASST